MQLNSDESQVLETEITEAEPENTEVETDLEGETEPDIEALKAEKEELEKKNRQLYERLKKQEKATTPATEGGLSEYDILALKNSNITDKDDLDIVKDYAKKLGMSIAEAIEDKYVQNVLADKKEERRTAQATEIRSPRGIAKTTGEDLLRRAEKTGEMPTTEDGMRALAEARLARRRK